MTKAILSFLSLGLIALGTLYLTDTYTRSRVEDNRLYQQNETVRELLKDREITQQPNSTGGTNPCDYWQITKLEVAGYSGIISGLALIEDIGKHERLSLRITAHNETPGIGDFIDHRKKSWIQALDGNSFEEWSDLDSVTGATITSLAILKMANSAFELERDSCGIQ